MLLKSSIQIVWCLLTHHQIKSLLYLLTQSAYKIIFFYLGDGNIRTNPLSAVHPIIGNVL